MLSTCDVQFCDKQAEKQQSLEFAGKTTGRMLAFDFKNN